MLSNSLRTYIRLFLILIPVIIFGAYIFKNAVNIPYTDLKENPVLPVEKDKTIVLYSYGSSDEVFEAAKLLQANGFRNVNVLHGGISEVRWKAANLKGKAALNDLVVNVPDL